MNKKEKKNYCTSLLIGNSVLCTMNYYTSYSSVVYWEYCRVYHKLLHASPVHCVPSFVYQQFLNDSRVYLGHGFVENYFFALSSIGMAAFCLKNYCTILLFVENVAYTRNYPINRFCISNILLFIMNGCMQIEMHGCIVHLEYLIVCQVLMHTRITAVYLETPFCIINY
jgi:hypothetical protein